MPAGREPFRDGAGRFGQRFGVRLKKRARDRRPGADRGGDALGQLGRGAFRNQHMRGSGSPTSMSMTRVPP